MLARLNAIAGIERAEVDHQGELLRLRASTTEALTAARAALLELGYDLSVASSLPQAIISWYDATTVRQLSREEAVTITARVLYRSAATQKLGAEDRERLGDAIAAALYGVFVTHELGAAAETASLLADCVRAGEIAAVPIVGSDGAREIASILERDLG